MTSNPAEHGDDLEHLDDLTGYPRTIRDRLRRAPHREQCGFPAGYDHAYELLVDAAPTDATDEELNTVHRIRQQLNPTFTVQELRKSRARAIEDAVSTASMLEAAGLTHEADVYRTLALQLTPSSVTASVSVGGR